MKRALGVNFGHDSAIALVSEKGVEKFLSKERVVRCKGAYGWDFATVERELAAHPDIPVGISTAQNKYGPIVGAHDRMSISGLPQNAFFEQHSTWEAPLLIERYSWMRDVDRDGTASVGIFEDWKSQVREFTNLAYTKSLRMLENAPDYARIAARYFDFASSPHYGMPECEISIDGKSRSAYAFMHHLSHATYAFWASGLEHALVVSYDGTASIDWGGGGYFWCSRKEGVKPLVPGGFWMGYLYDTVAKWTGVGAAGKLMGLAPYGQPRFFTSELVGSIGDIESHHGFEFRSLPQVWMSNVCGLKAPMSWDTSTTKVPRLAADIAASVQKIFEENILANVTTGLGLVKIMNKPIDGIVLVGGGALNCPANSRVHQAFDMKVFVPPACSDEGHALGNAIGAYFRAYGEFPPTPADPYDGVYLGPLYSDAEVQQATASLDRVGDFSADEVAKLLRDGAVMGIFHGRSEVGPRALGHRSILASPLLAGNWLKVNEVKGREPWRPFAPICLESDMDRYFTGSDMKSRFMLFTHQVKGKDLPAITHVDNSARAQAATPSCGLVFDVLTAFKTLTGHGVLMNTSFNGKDMPIVETPADAVAEAKRIGLDYLICAQGIFRVPNQ